MKFIILSPKKGEDVNHPADAMKKNAQRKSEVDALMQQKSRIASEYYQWQNRLQDDAGDPVKIQENRFALDQIELRWKQMKEINGRASKISQNLVEIPAKPDARGPVVVYSPDGNFTEEELESLDMANLAMIRNKLDKQRIKADRYIPLAKNARTKAANEKKIIQKVAEIAILDRIRNIKRQNGQNAT